MPDQDTISFDPYYKWLGIPPAEQPPDHYRLLGLRLFEEDREVIAIAADRQMSHIKSFAAGKFSQQSQSLLGELARAKLCLLNATRKAAYDSSLLDEVTSIEEVASIATPARSAELSTPSNLLPRSRQTVIAPVVNATPSREIRISLDNQLVHTKARRKKRSSGNFVFVWYLLTVSLAVMGFVIFHLSTRPEPPSQPHANIAPDRRTLIPDNQSNPRPRPKRRPLQNQNSNPQTPQFGQPPSPIPLAGKLELRQDIEPQSIPNKAETPPPNPGFVPPPATVDLLEVSDDRATALFAVPEGSSFELIPSTSSLILEGDRLEWIENDRKLIGGLVVSDGQLHFRWINDVPQEAEIAVRNSLIKLVSGDEVYVSALRSPVVGEPFRFDLSTPAQRILCKCDHLPVMQRIGFKISPDGLPSIDVDAIPARGLRFVEIMDIHFLEATRVSSRLEMSRVGAVPGVRFKSTFGLPSGEHRDLTFAQLKRVEVQINRDLSIIDADLARLGELLKKPPRGQAASIQSTIKALEEEKKVVLADQLELDRVAKLADQLHDKELIYRFFTVVDEYEVDLVVGKISSK